jgi:hypothetical protein
MSGIKDHHFESTEEIQYNASASLRAVTMETFEDDSSNCKITGAEGQYLEGEEVMIYSEKLHDPHM